MYMMFHQGIVLFVQRIPVCVCVNLTSSVAGQAPRPFPYRFGRIFWGDLPVPGVSQLSYNIVDYAMFLHITGIVGPPVRAVGTPRSPI